MVALIKTAATTDGSRLIIEEKMSNISSTIRWEDATSVMSVLDTERMRVSHRALSVCVCNQMHDVQADINHRVHTGNQCL